MRRWLKRLVKRGEAAITPTRWELLEERLARIETANAALEARLELLSGDATILAKALLEARKSTSDINQR